MKKMLLLLGLLLVIGLFAFNVMAHSEEADDDYAEEYGYGCMHDYDSHPHYSWWHLITPKRGW